MKYSKYAEQYCEKHDQWYAEYLSECPICAGERMTCQPPPPNGRCNCKRCKENSSHKPKKKQVRLVKRPTLIKRKTTKEHSTPKLFNF